MENSKIEKLEKLEKIEDELLLKNKEVARIQLSIDEYTELLKAKNKEVGKLKENIEQLITKGEKISTNNYSYFWKNTKAILIENEEEIPKKYFKLSIKSSIDKINLKKDLENNFKIDGVTLEENFNLQMRKLKGA